MATSDSNLEIGKQKKTAILLLLASTIVAVFYTWWQLDQLQRGQLFLIQLSGEKPASSYELFDAKQSATQFMFPAILCVILLGGLAMFLIIRWKKLTFHSSKLWKLLAAVLVLTALLDLATTINFFHKEGIHLEIHPGIRLFGYAYGRTIGPLLGKSVQVLGVLFLSLLTERVGILILLAVTFAYASGGIYNLMQL